MGRRLLAVALTASLASPGVAQADGPAPPPVPANRQSWYALTIGPFAGLRPEKWGARVPATSPDVDLGGELSYWHYWQRSPVMLGCDLGIGNRAAYAEIQATPANAPIVGLGLGGVHAWRGDLGLAGFQATAWVGFLLVLYGRVEAYRGGNGIATAGLMLKLPAGYTGGF